MSDLPFDAADLLRDADPPLTDLGRRVSILLDHLESFAEMAEARGQVRLAQIARECRDEIIDLVIV